MDTWQLLHCVFLHVQKEGLLSYKKYGENNEQAQKLFYELQKQPSFEAFFYVSHTYISVEQALGWFPLGWGLDEPSELSCSGTSLRLLQNTLGTYNLKCPSIYVSGVVLYTLLSM